MPAKKRTKTQGKKLQRASGFTGSAHAYEGLKELIISGELKPGSDLDEQDLVKRFEVSRTPVREALIRLSSEGLVSMLPNRGAKVSNLNFSDVTDHLEIMDILTPSVCYLAALRRTSTDLNVIKEQVDRLSEARRDDLTDRLDAIFHLYTALGKATHNESLHHVYRLTIYAKLRLGRVSATRTETEEEWEAHMADLRKVYNEIFSTIEARDGPGAQSAARQWMNLIRERLSSAVSSSPTLEIDVLLNKAG
jgi:DNA-binding GntR family transcriptional regulator